MKDRRPLSAGIQPSGSSIAELEKQFVYSGRFNLRDTDPTDETAQHTPPTETVSMAPETLSPLPAEDTEANTTPEIPKDRVQPFSNGRIAITTRTRPEVATALKQASLKRQLAGVEPHFVQDIMEEALEAWLKAKGYL